MKRSFVRIVLATTLAGPLLVAKPTLAGRCFPAFRWVYQLFEAARARVLCPHLQSSPGASVAVLTGMSTRGCSLPLLARRVSLARGEIALGF